MKGTFATRNHSLIVNSFAPMDNQLQLIFVCLMHLYSYAAVRSSLKSWLVDRDISTYSSLKYPVGPRFARDFAVDLPNLKEPYGAADNK